MKLAVISDIHGNSYALKEVLADIQRKNIDKIVNLGDSLYGPLDPKGTYELLKGKGVMNISGNQDRFITENLNTESQYPTLEYVKSKINPEIVQWLEEQPSEGVLDNKIYCCHGIPGNDKEYLLEEINDEYVGVKKQESLEEILRSVEREIILCGHSHLSRLIEYPGRIIINPGSVGLQAYDDELPLYHKIENYNPKARYAVIELLSDKVNVEHVAVSYNFEEAVALAEKNKRYDWAKWIRTGRVS